MLSALCQDRTDQRPLRCDSLVEEQQDDRQLARPRRGLGLSRTPLLEKLRELFEQRASRDRVCREMRLERRCGGAGVREPLEPVPVVQALARDRRADDEVARAMQCGGLKRKPAPVRCDALGGPADAGRAERAEREHDRHVGDGPERLDELGDLLLERLVAAPRRGDVDEGRLAARADAQGEEVFVLRAALPELRAAGPRALDQFGGIRREPAPGLQLGRSRGSQALFQLVELPLEVLLFLAVAALAASAGVDVVPDGHQRRERREHQADRVLREEPQGQAAEEREHRCRQRNPHPLCLRRRLRRFEALRDEPRVDLRRSVERDQAVAAGGRRLARLAPLEDEQGLPCAHELAGLDAALPAKRLVLDERLRGGGGAGEVHTVG